MSGARRAVRFVRFDLSIARTIPAWSRIRISYKLQQLSGCRPVMLLTPRRRVVMVKGGNRSKRGGPRSWPSPYRQRNREPVAVPPTPCRLLTGALHKVTRVSDCEQHTSPGSRAGRVHRPLKIRLLFVINVVSAAWGIPHAASSRRCSRASLKWVLVVEAVRDGDHHSARVGL